MLDTLLYLLDVAHGNAHVHMPRGIDQAVDALVVLPALFPDIHKHIRLGVIQERVRRGDQLRGAGNGGTVLDQPRQGPGRLVDPVDLLHPNVASRRGNHDVKHIHDEVRVHRGIVAQRDEQVDLILAVDDFLIDVQDAVDPVIPFLQHVRVDIAGTYVFVDRKDLQLGSGL